MLKHVRVPSRWIVPAAGTLISPGIPGGPSPAGRPEGPLSLPLPLIPAGSGEAKLIFSCSKGAGLEGRWCVCHNVETQGQEFEI